MTKANMILQHVKAHAKYWQDDYCDYPSFIYQIDWHGKRYTAMSYNDLTRQILKSDEEL